MTAEERVREEMTHLAGECYTQEGSACPNHPVFQPQKFINLILSAGFVKCLTPKEGFSVKTIQEIQSYEASFTKEELADLRHNACDDTIG